jgi:hypothetical protein
MNTTTTTTTTTTTDKDQFLNNRKMKTLLNSRGQIIGERVRGTIHVYLGGKKDYHRAA